MFFLYLILVILALWAYSAYKRNLIPDSSKKPPLIEPTLPILGHLHFFMFGNDAHFLAILETIFTKTIRLGGGVSRVMIGPKAYYLVTDPEDCATVANSCISKPRLPYAFLNTYLGSGIFNEQNGHLWKSQRKVVNPAFNQHMLDEFLYVFNDQTRDLVKELRKHVGAGPFDQTVYMANYTLDSVVRTSLDISEDNIETKNQIVEDSSRLFELAALRITNVWLFSDFIYRVTALGKEEKQRSDRLNRLTEEIINKKKLQLIRDNDTAMPAGRKFKPVLNILLELEDSGVFTRKEVMDQINTIIAGGFHTTSNMLSFLLCAIGTYPKVQDRIYNELLEVFGTSDRNVEKKDLAEMVYLEAVIKETLRLYTIVPIIARHGDTAVKLKEYTIPKNSCYILLLGATHRLQIWGQDREVFRPERWLDPTTVPENPNTFTAFSIGRRACIGRAYAMNFLKVACAHILREYKIISNINKIQMRLHLLYSCHSGHEISIENRR